MSLGVLASAGFNPAGLEPLDPVFLLASSVSCFALGESIIVFGALLSFQKSCDPFDMQSEKKKYFDCLTFAEKRRPMVTRTTSDTQRMPPEEYLERLVYI